VANGIAAPINDKYIDLNSDKWNEAEKQFMTVGGKLYGLYAGNSEPRGCLYFNKRVLEEAGIDWNTIYDAQKDGKWTWAMFEDMLKTITRDTDNDGVNDIYGILGSGDDMYVCAVFSNGGSFFDFDENGKLQPTMNSDATISALRSQANQFAASVSNNDELVANAAKQGIQVVNGQYVSSMAANIGQLPNCREIVSWSFGDDVKKDDISDVFYINKMYFAVASVAKVREVGEQKYKEVKDEIKTMLEHQNKVELVAEQLNKDLASGGMQAVAQKYSVPVTDSVMLSFAGDYYMNRGVENKAVGQIFGLQVNKPTAVTGNNMAYVVNVLETSPGQATENLMLEKNYLQNAVLGRERNENTLLSYLINQTKVLDNRVRFYQK
jgi:hypothetical protein